MVSKAEIKKRRARAKRADTHHREVAAPRTRRRKLFVNVGAAFLALMYLVPVAGGFVTSLASDDATDPVATVETVPTTIAQGGLVDPGFEGAVSLGPTPCPATDGTEQRTTQFSEPPPMCIGDDESFTVTLDTLGGPVDLTVDATRSAAAANLFVTLARYGVYDGAPIYPFPGVVTIGGLGDAGFRVEGALPPDDGLYPVGAVVMLTDFDGSLEGQFIVVTDEQGSAALEAAGQDPIIGMVTDGLDSIAALRELMTANDTATYRVQAAAVAAAS